jgi:LPS sulfotransferase NodH
VMRSDLLPLTSDLPATAAVGRASQAPNVRGVGDVKRSGAWAVAAEWSMTRGRRLWLKPKWSSCHYGRRMRGAAEYAEWVRRPSLPERPVPPSSSYVICTTPRGASWLLCGLLASTGLAGRPHEWFLDAVEAANTRSWGAKDFAEYLRLVSNAGTTPNGVFGVKLMWAYFDSLLARLRTVGDPASDRQLIERHLPRPRFVWLRRDDVDAQAVSWAKAVQTGYWHHWDKRDPAIRPVYDREQINALRRAAIAHDVAWRDWFSANDIAPLVVTFEDLVADPAAVTRAVLRFLGIDPGDTPIVELTTSTHDSLATKWLARYRHP